MCMLGFALSWIVFFSLVAKPFNVTFYRHTGARIPQGKECHHKSLSPLCPNPLYPHVLPSPDSREQPPPPSPPLAPLLTRTVMISPSCHFVIPPTLGAAHRPVAASAAAAAGGGGGGGGGG